MRQKELGVKWGFSLLGRFLKGGEGKRETIRDETIFMMRGGFFEPSIPAKKGGGGFSTRS